MSLMRLLTTGKSWVNDGDGASRYRLRRNLLPKFGSGQNPFSARSRTKAAAAAKAESEAGCEPSESPAPIGPGVPDPVREIPERRVEVARGEGAPAVVRKPLTKESRLRSLWEQAPRWLGGCLRKANVFSWWSQRTRKVKPAIPRFNKTPIQGELSLEQVKVVRNDLSDADLEVVPARSSAVRHQSQPVERVEAVLSGPPDADRAASAPSGACDELLGAGKT
jgi:hypothetical protein